jgi:hypothetical protein
MYELDESTGKPKVDPVTGRLVRRYDSDVYLIESDTGRPAIDPATGKKVLKKQMSRHAYEIDYETNKPKFDPETGRPIRKKDKKKRLNADGEMESETQTEYEIDPYTG